MSSASVQSTIQAFEALSSSSVAITSNIPTAARSRPSSLTSNLLESPLSPSASAFHPISPCVAPNPSAISRSSSPSSSSLTAKTSLIDLKDWIVEDGPVERRLSTSRLVIPNSTGKLNDIRESSKTPCPSRQSVSVHATVNSSAPLINFDSHQKSRPPLPPRKPSLNTVDCVTTHNPVSADNETRILLCPPPLPGSVTIEHTYPPNSRKFGAGRVGHVSASSISSFHSVSLSSDGSNAEVHSPQLPPKLPSLTVEADNSGTDFDTASIAESFENVSVSSAMSPSTPITFDWEHAIGKSKISAKRELPSLHGQPSVKIPPVIPPKPLTRSVSISSSSTTGSTKTRRPPPPPPPYQLRSIPSSSRASVASASASASDRSSILSNATTTSRTSISARNSAQFGANAKSPLLRQTPVPPAARSRYEALFDSAVKGRRRAEKRRVRSKLLASRPPPRKDRQAAGWRGLSVDLVANSEDHSTLSSETRASGSGSEEEEELSPVGPDERLSGRIVKHIWCTSQLDRKMLNSIWNGCDPQCTGLVNRDAFVKGMWRIDEELRKAQLAQRTSALTAASSQRIPHRPFPLPGVQRTTRLLV